MDIFPLHGRSQIQESYEISPNEVEHVPGGLISRSLLDLNIVRKSYPNFSRIVEGIANYNAIQSFLISHKGTQPFQIDFLGNSNYTIVLCSEWSWKPIAPGVWEFSGVFVEDFAL